MHRTKTRVKNGLKISILIIAVVLLLSEYSYYNEYEYLSGNEVKTLKHQVIKDSNLNGYCDLYYKKGTNEYWLYYTDNNQNRNYIGGFRDIKGKLAISVSDYNQLAIAFTYDNETKKDKVVHLDLDKNETYKITVFSLIHNLF
jgi:hypothetical protein